MNNVGRNDPCPCGSGKKYKKCSLGREEAVRARQAPMHEGDQPPPTTPPPLEPDDEVDRLMEAVERGEGKAVKGRIAALYSRAPDHCLTGSGAVRKPASALVKDCDTSKT